MKVKITQDKEYAEKIRSLLKNNGGYCPCMLEKNEDTRCMCKDFRENVAVGEFCHCGLYQKISR